MPRRTENEQDEAFRRRTQRTLPQQVAFTAPNPGGLYIPDLGRTFQQVILKPFTHSYIIKGSHQVVLPPDDEWVIASIGAKLSPTAQVWIDEQLEKSGSDDAAHLRVFVQGREHARFSLLHLDYFFPQLHDLPGGLPVEVHRRELLTLTAPPDTLVVIAGICKSPLLR